MQTVKAYIVPIIKAILAIAIIGSIYHVLVVQKNIGELILELRNSQSSLNFFCLGLALVLVIPNWLLEASKWKCAMDRYGGISYRDSAVSIVCGVAVGLVTPARVGEYAGRLIIVGKEKYRQALISTFICSLSQLIVTVAIGGAIFIWNFRTFDFGGISYSLIKTLSAAALVLLAFAYLDLSRVIRIIAKNRWAERKLGELVGIEHRLLLQLKLLVLAFTRYVVYTLQYYLILKFCGVELSGLLMLSHIAIIFFLQSLMPLPPVAAFFARTGVALMVLASINVNELISVSSSLILWVINLTLPALVGLYFIIKRKNISE